MYNIREFILCSIFIIAANKAFSTTMDNTNKALNTITIVTGDYSPFIDRKMSDYGQVSRLVTDAFSEVDINVEYVFLPWARAIRSVKKGQKVAVMYYGKTKEREIDFLFSDPIFREEWLLFHKKDITLTWHKLKDLSQYNFGATLSYTYTTEFHLLAKQQILNVSWVGSDKQNWQMMMKDRVDVIPFPKIGWLHLQKLYSKETLSTITTAEKPLSSQLNYLLFSKKHEHGRYFQSKFNEGFTLLKQKHNLSNYLPLEKGSDWPK